MTDSTLEPPSTKVSDGSALEQSLTSSSKSDHGDTSANRDSVLVIVDVKDDEVVFREEQLNRSKPSDKCATALVENDFNDNHAVPSHGVTAIDSHGDSTQNVKPLELTKENESSKISHFAEHGVTIDQIAGKSLECTNSVSSESKQTVSSLCSPPTSKTENPVPAESSSVTSSQTDAGHADFVSDEVPVTAAESASTNPVDISGSEASGLHLNDSELKLEDSKCDIISGDNKDSSVDGQTFSEHSRTLDSEQKSNPSNSYEDTPKKASDSPKKQRKLSQNIKLTHPPRRASTGLIESQTKRLFQNVKRVVSNADAVATYGNVLKDANRRHNASESDATETEQAKEPKQPDCKSEMDLIRARINSMSPSDKMRKSQIMYRTRTTSHAMKDNFGLYRSKSCSQADKLRLRPASPSPMTAFIHAPILSKATSDSLVPELSEQPEEFTLPFEKQPTQKNNLLSKRTRSDSKTSHLHDSGSISLPVSADSERDKSSDKNNSSNENLKSNLDTSEDKTCRRTVSFRDPEIEANIPARSSIRRSKRMKKRKRSRHASSDTEKESLSDGLTEFDLYIQSNSDMLLLLLLDRNAGRTQDTVHGLVSWGVYKHTDGLVQDCSNSIALATGLLQSCTKPSICWLNNKILNTCV